MANAPTSAVCVREVVAEVDDVLRVNSASHWIKVEVNVMGGVTLHIYLATEGALLVIAFKAPPACLLERQGGR